MAEYNTESTGEDSNVVSSSFIWTILLTVLTSVILVRMGHVGWAWGYSVGAGLSIISLFSLGTLVPMLMLPKAPAASQFLLTLVLFMKLPLYGISLYLVTRMQGVDARSAFPGILMAPMIITGQTVGKLVCQSVCEAVHKRQIRRGGVRILRSRRSRIAAPLAIETAREQG